MIGAPLLSSMRVSLVTQLPSESTSSLSLSTTTWYLPIRLRAPVTHKDGGSGGGATPNRVRFNRSFFFLVGSRRWDGSIFVYSSSLAWYALMRTGKDCRIRLQSKLSVVSVSASRLFMTLWEACLKLILDLDFLFCKIPRAHFLWIWSWTL